MAAGVLPCAGCGTGELLRRLIEVVPDRVQRPWDRAGHHCGPPNTWVNMGWPEEV